MLRELHISDLAVIENLAIEFDAGLNVFTGQTGAGKSLVIGAFEILLGLRSGSDMVRPGADEARISGVFEVADASLAAQIGSLIDQAIEPGEGLLITRKLFASGRSSTSVNGQPATAAMVKQAGQLLVDIHGQHDHQYLLKPSNQLAIIDGFARCEGLREQFAAAWHRRRELVDRKEELATSRKLRQQQLELYEFQADEIDAAEPSEGEFAELQARERLLRNVQKIQTDASGVHAALYESEGSIAERLQIATHVLQDLAELDEAVEPIAGQVRDATLALHEAAFELSRYISQLDHDPEEAGEVEQRLNILNRLIQKYGEDVPSDDPMASVLSYREQIGAEIASLRGEESDLGQIDAELESLRAELLDLAAKLRRAREKAAGELVPLIEKELKELGMSDARFKLELTPVELDDDLAGPSGLDQLEMVAQTNPGQAFRPLRKIASGGELSRIMLALKSILAGSDRISVLVFDEIDANIGGRLGSVIGEKLRGLANPGANGKGKRRGPLKGATPGDHQVLCITHLPQIAAYGDQHFRIEKSVTGKGKTRVTRTTVVPMDGPQRVDELAEMLAGKDLTPTAKKQAKELLARAQP